MPPAARDAFFELVLHPAKAYGQVAELYIAAGRNRLYAAQGRASANDQAARVKALFQADIDLANYYNHTLAQRQVGPHDGPDPYRIHLLAGAAAQFHARSEGDRSALTQLPWAWRWSGPEQGSLPEFDVFNRQRRYIDVFNKGKASFDFTAAASAPWIELSAGRGRVEKVQRLWVTVDWSQAPAGSSTGTVRITGPGSPGVSVKVAAFRPREVTPGTLRGFVEGDGYVSIEAEHYSKSNAVVDARWEKIDDYGRTLSAMSVFPVAAPAWRRALDRRLSNTACTCSTPARSR